MNNLYVYAKPNQMEGHAFSDDVAIARANNKQEAMEKFEKLYACIEWSDVRLIEWANEQEVKILTDY